MTSELYPMRALRVVLRIEAFDDDAPTLEALGELNHRDVADRVSNAVLAMLGGEGSVIVSAKVSRAIQ